MTMGRTAAGFHRFVAAIAATTVLVVIATTLWAAPSNGIEWLGVYRYHGQRYWNRTADCRFQPQQRSSTSMPATGSRANGGNGKKRPSAASSAILVRDQRRMCQRNLELMSTVVHAARVAIDVCQMQFRDSRWNCSSSLSAPHLTPDLTSGSREQAFVVALAAASLSQSISKACSSGVTNKCGCAGPMQSAHLAALTVTPPIAGASQTLQQAQLPVTPRPYAVPPAAMSSVPGSNRSPGRPSPTSPGNGQDFQWGGCGDDVAFGLEFGQKFGSARWIRRAPSLKSLNDLHNQRVGRKILAGSLTTSCKCHGVSGSCALKTCWRALPDMRTVSDLIARAYHESSVEVTSLPSGGGQRPLSLVGIRTGSEIGEDSLSYYSLSPDYCLPDLSLGAVGTHGRECLKDHPGSAGCRSMCCGRRFTTETVTRRYRCDCKYHWCCYVKCRICSEEVEVHRCT